MARYARIVNGTTLQAPVHQYVHRNTGRQVTLIGTMHLGEAGYYRNLRELIAQREADGFVVQCEGGRRLGVASSNDLTEHEAGLLDELRRFTNMEDAAVTALGWTGHVQGLGYPVRWQVVDLPLIEIMRTVGPDLFWRQARRAVLPLETYENPLRGLAWFRVQAVIGLRAAGSGKLTRRTSGEQVVVDQRNVVALRGVEGTDHDLVLLWGPAHLPGLDAGLREHGFNRAATEWYDVAQQPTVAAAIWRAIRSKRRTRTGTDADAVAVAGGAQAAGSRGSAGAKARRFEQEEQGVGQTGRFDSGGQARSHHPPLAGEEPDSWPGVVAVKLSRLPPAAVGQVRVRFRAAAVVFALGRGGRCGACCDGGEDSRD